MWVEFQQCKFIGWILSDSKNSRISVAVCAHTLTLVCMSLDDFLPVSDLCFLSSLWVKGVEPPCLCVNKEQACRRTGAGWNGRKRCCVAEIPKIPCSRFSLLQRPPIVNMLHLGAWVGRYAACLLHRQPKTKNQRETFHIHSIHTCTQHRMLWCRVWVWRCMSVCSCMSAQFWVWKCVSCASVMCRTHSNEFILQTVMTVIIQQCSLLKRLLHTLFCVCTILMLCFGT